MHAFAPEPFSVYVGLTTDSLTEIYLRPTIAESMDFDPAKIEIRGPFCAVAKTLKTTTNFRRFDHQGLWQARLVDPCFWSPDYPAYYRIRIEQVGQITELICGIRRFGAKNGQFWLEGKRWVLRATKLTHVPDLSWQSWREARLAIFAGDPAPNLLELATEQGLMLMLDLEQANWSDRLPQVAKSPAVVIVVVPLDASLERCRELAPNLLIAKRLPDDKFASALDQVDVLLCDLGQSSGRTQLHCREKPVIGYRGSPGLTDLVTARAACDALQRDLAPEFDLSGYVV